MMGILEKLGAWGKTAGNLNGDLAAALARQTLHDAAKPTSADPAEHRKWRAAGREIADEIASIEDSLRIAEEHRAAAQAAANEAEADADHAAAQKLASAHAGEIRGILADSQKLAARIERAEELRTKIGAANAVRGNRPFIADGETSVRGIPGKTLPAVYETVTVWEDGAGNAPYQYRTVGGEQVPIEQGFTKKRKRVQVRAEQHILPTMPERLAQAIRLVDKAGNRIWPRT